MPLPEVLVEARQEIVDQVIADLQTDGLRFTQPWVATLTPTSLVSGMQYQGGNVLHLAHRARKMGYTDNRWITFRAASERGWKVKKGEKSTAIEHWKLAGIKSTQASDGDDDSTVERLDVRPICVGYYRLFNVEQIDGDIPAPLDKHPAYMMDKPIDAMSDTLIKSSRCPVVEGLTDSAYYSLTRDCVNMPPRTAFQTSEGFLRTLSHELIHSTGHASALNRPFSGAFGSEDYAKEELVAELGAMFVASKLDIPMSYDLEPSNHYYNHLAYIKSWISILEDNPNTLFSAATQASKAANYIADRYMSTTGVSTPELS